MHKIGNDLNQIAILNITTEHSYLSEDEIKAIENEKSQYENARAASIGALKLIQKNRGWVSLDAIKAISSILNISVNDIEGVATFYNQIFRQPVGRHIIRYCDSVVCYITGYKKNLTILKTSLNIQPGRTTSDNRFTLLPTCCLGNCDKSPVIMINEDSYVNVTPEVISSLLEIYK